MGVAQRLKASASEWWRAVIETAPLVNQALDDYLGALAADLGDIDAEEA